MPTLDIVDNAAIPSGVLVTPDVPVYLHVVRLGDGGALSDSFFGIVDTPLSLPLPAGPYVFAAVDAADPSDHSPIYQVRVTDGRPAPGTFTRRAVADRIAAIGLTGVTVYEQWNGADVSNVTFPAILLTVEDVSETVESRLSSADDIGYPVRVSIIDRQDQYDQDTLPDYEMWRWLIDKAFREQQLPGVPESVYCKIEYDRIGNPNLPKFQYLVSEFVIRAVVRLYRGL